MNQILPFIGVNIKEKRTYGRKTYNPKKYTVDKSGAVRFDFLFSYWLLIWFIIYYFISPSDSKIVKFITNYMNPIYGLLFALIENIIVFIFIIKSHFEWWWFFIYIFMMVSIKILPIYLLQNSKIQFIPNIISFGIIFGLYNIYLHANDTNLYEIYNKTIQSYKEGNDQTPLFNLIHNIFLWFK